jgi:hypothetical protein
LPGQGLLVDPIDRLKKNTMNRLSTLSLRPHQNTLPMAPLQPVFVKALVAVIATASLCAHAQTPPREPSVPYVVKGSDKLLLLGKQLLINSSDWAEVARFNQLKDPNLIVAGQRLNIPVRFLRSVPGVSTVISVDGDVTLAGAPVKAGDTVPVGSAVKTGAGSLAVLELADGSRIKVMPNTLTAIVTSTNYPMRDSSKAGTSNWFSGLMRLTSGALEAVASKTAKRATELQIQTQTSTVGVRGTEFRVAYDDPASGGARTEVLEGKVRADNPAQQTGADLPMGTGAVIKPAEAKVNVVKLLPAPDLSSTNADLVRPQVQLALPVLPGAAAFRVQVSDTEKFDKILSDVKVDSDPANANAAFVALASVPVGPWVVRVRGIDAQGLEGFDTVKRFTVRNAMWRVSYSTLSVLDGRTYLNWTGMLGDRDMTAYGYTAVLATDAALSQNVQKFQTAYQRLDLGMLQPGTYFLQLKSQTELAATDAPARFGAATGTAHNGLSTPVMRLDVPVGWGDLRILNSALTPIAP